jgi:hypothetical protein
MKTVKTYKTLESAKKAADLEFSLHGWFVAVVPIVTTGRYMLCANPTDDMVYSVGKEE